MKHVGERMTEGICCAMTGDLHRCSCWVKGGDSDIAGFAWSYSKSFNSWTIVRRIELISENLPYTDPREGFSDFADSVGEYLKREFPLSASVVSLLLLGRAKSGMGLGFIVGAGSVWRLVDSVERVSPGVEVMGLPNVSLPEHLRALPSTCISDSGRDGGFFFEFKPGRIAVVVGSLVPEFSGRESTMLIPEKPEILGAMVDVMVSKACSALAAVLDFDDYL